MSRGAEVLDNVHNNMRKLPNLKATHKHICGPASLVIESLWVSINHLITSNAYNQPVSKDGYSSNVSVFINISSYLNLFPCQKAEKRFTTTHLQHRRWWAPQFLSLNYPNCQLHFLPSGHLGGNCHRVKLWPNGMSKVRSPLYKLFVYKCS